jgi:EAL domain-containing protein (putative c-di-GMP-specific phosphodiesterase class I)
LKNIKGIGVKIAVDNFGIGYSNLNNIKQYPIDTLKIDFAFLQGSEKEPHVQAIVEDVVSTATSYGMTLSGERVETKEQAGLLQSLGIKYGQGNLFSPLLSAAELEALLKKKG